MEGKNRLLQMRTPPPVQEHSEGVRESEDGNREGKQEDVDASMKNSSSPPGIYTCNSCKQTFTTQANMKRHEQG